jgi:DNA-binding NarL/FixJ family response regulator
VERVRKLRVLLADDHLGFLEKVASLLDPNFDVVGRVGDGKALFDAAMDLKPDVIVTDISMPILNGVEAVTMLRESGNTSKVVFVTVHTDLDFLRTCLATGASGYVVKPRVTTDLLPAIEGATAGSIFISPSLNYQNPA